MAHFDCRLIRPAASCSSLSCTIAIVSSTSASSPRTVTALNRDLNNELLDPKTKILQLFATRGDDCGYVPRNYLVEEEALVSEAVLVQEHVLTIESEAHLTLSPMDWANRGRAIPCTWFFAHVLPPQKLVDALRDTLNGLPHFAAR